MSRNQRDEVDLTGLIIFSVRGIAHLRDERPGGENAVLGRISSVGQFGQHRGEQLALRHRRDDATLSNLPACRRFGCASQLQRGKMR